MTQSERVFGNGELARVIVWETLKRYGEPLADTVCRDSIEALKSERGVQISNRVLNVYAVSLTMGDISRRGFTGIKLDPWGLRQALVATLEDFSKQTPEHRRLFLADPTGPLASSPS